MAKEPALRKILACLPFLWALPAYAVDGRIEINQASAIAGGVTPSDAPGFPVTIDTPGSYVLTSALILVTPSVDGIELVADDVTIDLNGFAIVSISTCSVGSCGLGSAVGIGSLGAGLRNNITIHSGTVRGFSGPCIKFERGAHVHHMLLDQCGGNGIEVTFQGIVTKNRVRNIGAYGLFLGDGSLYADNNISATGFNPFSGGNVSGGEDGGGNLCDQLLCKPISIPRRQYYLSTNSVPANQMTFSCRAGSHTASLVELADPSHLFYDASFGETRLDSGAGPPHGIAGWMRTGNDDETAGTIGASNCNHWTSVSSQHRGTVAELSTDWTSVPPWVFSIGFCDQVFPVWCLDD